MDDPYYFGPGWAGEPDKAIVDDRMPCTTIEVKDEDEDSVSDIFRGCFDDEYVSKRLDEDTFSALLEWQESGNE